MEIQFLTLARQYELIENKIQDAVASVLNGGFFVLGHEVEKFEEKFAKYSGAKYCVGVNSGTDALEIALRSLGITDGDEVITTSNTFIATVMAISKVGAVPVFADVDDDYQIDIADFTKKITSKTKAVIVVHLFGFPTDMDAIKKVTKKNKLFLVEDACQAHGATFKGRRVGSFGDVSCFSFYPGKNLGAYGDGGALVTSSKKIFTAARLLRNYGQKIKYKHELIGYNSRLDEIQATILSVKLDYLDDWNKERRKLAKLYIEELSDVKEVVLPKEKTHCISAFHLFVIRVKKRKELQEYLLRNGINTMIHYPIPVHRQIAYKEYNDIKLPNTELFAKEILSLPLYPELTEREVKYVANAVKSFYEK
ncbi:MAG: DegT/DnrJ/EryC1/StrS family aminotransferase [Candidatus Moranbacteria bacterium]|nr:DegT/DnrJ/EryC1/StrS family aminotransferase [Candidatus Moranbacteria bacterium]